MEHLFTFPARIDLIADHARQVIDALGDTFRSALILAAIHEALVNAVVYGALGIPPPVAARDLDDLLARIRLAEAERPGALVQASIARSGGERVVRISDPGPGFDWRAWLSSGRHVVPPSLSWSNVPTHGRGLVIMQAGSQSMWWNDEGNEVSMRFHPSEVVPAVVQLPDTQPGVAGWSNRRLLVVSGDAASRVGLRHAVQALGYDVRECEDPEEAPQLIDSWAPCLVLVQVSLAGDQGHATLLQRIASLRKAARPATIAFASSRVDPVVISYALESGALDVLELPMWKADLENRLEIAIRTKKPID